MSVEFDTYCGLSCSTCELKEKNQCGGCIATKGNPYHGTCEVAKCAISKNRRFCGECSEIPCDILKKYSFDLEHGDNGARIENCQKIKLALVNEARKGVDPVSVCGHHCDYCFMGQWCGGCLSNYNCCSYATISEDGICPNVKCAKSKSLKGCYDCDELASCTKGYYSNTNEYVAKATAFFVNKYGPERYTKALKTAIDAGEDYPKSFDASGSVEAALKLLEKYLI